MQCTRFLVEISVQSNQHTRGSGYRINLRLIFGRELLMAASQKVILGRSMYIDILQNEAQGDQFADMVLKNMRWSEKGSEWYSYSFHSSQMHWTSSFGRVYQVDFTAYMMIRMRALFNVRYRRHAWLRCQIADVEPVSTGAMFATRTVGSVLMTIIHQMRDDNTVAMSGLDETVTQAVLLYSRPDGPWNSKGMMYEG